MMSPMREAKILPVSFFILILAACGDNDDSGGGGGGGGERDAGGTSDLPTLDFVLGEVGGGEEDTVTGVEPEITFECPMNHTVEDDWNEGWSVAGATRRFHANLPSSNDVPWAVVFSWHGYGDSAESFVSFFGTNPDGDASFPIAVITPDDSGMSPFSNPPGLDWDIFISHAGDGNLDAAFFEAILGCLDDQFDIDAGAIFSVGFSAGAVMTDLLHSRYSDLVHTVVAISGVFFNDEEELETIQFPAGINFTLEWDAIEQSSSGAVMLTHGGPSDAFAMAGTEIMNFEDAAEFAVPFLLDAGRTVINCPHSNGHQPHPGVSLADMVEFFRDHAGGGDSPYLGGNLPGSLSSDCSVE
jgi:predicted esterase